MAGYSEKRRIVARERESEREREREREREAPREATSRGEKGGKASKPEQSI
jgi:hypothetical protein